MKIIKISIGVMLLMLIVSSCKKEVFEEDFEPSEYPFTILNQETGAPYYFFKRKSGGYMLILSDIIGGGVRKDVKVIVLDDNMKVINQTSFGGSKDETIWQGVQDEDGYVYLCGYTNSPDLRMDIFTKDISSEDGYLVKLDPHGELVWQLGFSDTAAPWQGYFGDSFDKIFLKNNKLYIAGSNASWRSQPFDLGTQTWIIEFDKNGEFLSQRNLPTFVPKDDWSSGVVNRTSCQLADGDIITGMVNIELFRTGTRNSDTTATINRYNPDSDSVIWTKYFKAGTPEGDIMHIGSLKNGDILGFTSDFAMGIRLNQFTGDVIETWTTNASIGFEGDFYISADYSTIFSVGDAHYIVGAVDRKLGIEGNTTGVVFNNSRPWVLKLDEMGKTVYSRDFPVPNGYFYNVVDANENLVFLGGIHAFGSKRFTTFLYTSDKDGNFVKP